MEAQRQPGAAGQVLQLYAVDHAWYRLPGSISYMHDRSGYFHEQA
jgi:hypothetical protein